MLKYVLFLGIQKTDGSVWFWAI